MNFRLFCPCCGSMQERNNLSTPWKECSIPLSVTFFPVMKRCFSLIERSFIDIKTFCIDTKSSPPWTKGIFSLIKTFCELKVGRFKLTECFLIEQGSSSPGLEITLSSQKVSISNQKHFMSLKHVSVPIKYATLSSQKVFIRLQNVSVSL